ncbi:hypothetical protein ACHAWC_002736 [Mediolabrus comicus]
MMLSFIISSGNSRRISAQIALITLSCAFLLCGAIDKKLSTTDDIVKDIALEITDHDGIFRLGLNEIQKENMKDKLSAVFSSADNGISATTTTQGFLLQRRDKNRHSTKTSRLLKRDEDRSRATSESVLAQRSSASNCLEPPDPLRTCFRRSIDPHNHYDYDFIDRKKYNLEGKRGTLPYLALDEQVFYGTMIISMLDNEQDIDTCDSRLGMEELLLTFLADNIGGSDTYTPICAFMDKYAFEYQEVPETDEEITGTAFHFQLTFAQSSRVPNWRRLESTIKEEEEQSVFLQNDLIERDLRKDKKKKNQKENNNDGGKKVKQTNTSNIQRNDGRKKNRKNNGSKEKNSGQKNRPNNEPNSGRNTGNKTKDKTKKKANIKEKEQKYVKPTMKPTLLNCRASDQAMCCSQVAINGSPGAYCVELGCDLSLCGSGRKQQIDDSWKGGWGGTNGWSGRQRQLKKAGAATTGSRKLKNASFNDLVADYTPYNPTQTYAQLDIDFEFANSCSINRFSLGQYGTPSLFCSVFREQRCEQNNDLLPSVEEEFSDFCIDDTPTYSPTLKVTESPSASPSDHPTSLPSSSPTLRPTPNPTPNPTPQPSPEPTKKPTKKPTPRPTPNPTPNPTPGPTKSPTLFPTYGPSKNPTLSPSRRPTLSPSASPTDSPVLPSPPPTREPSLSPTLKPNGNDE